MDAEQLKQIIELLQGLGIEAKEAFIYYLLFTGGVELASILTFTLVTLVAVTLTYRLLTTLVRASNYSYEMSRKIGTPVIGTWVSSDTEMVDNRIKELLDYEIQCKQS